MFTFVDKLKSNPLLDPFVEAGYCGHSIRGTAHRHSHERFRPSVEIRYNDEQSDGLYFECVCQDTFCGADPALEWAMNKGREMVDGLLRHRVHSDLGRYQHQHSR